MREVWDRPRRLLPPSIRHIRSLPYEFGLDPKHFSQGFHFTVERVSFGLAFLQHLPDFVERLLIEAAAGLPHMNQSPLFVIQAKND